MHTLHQQVEVSTTGTDAARKNPTLLPSAYVEGVKDFAITASCPVKFDFTTSQTTHREASPHNPTLVSTASFISKFSFQVKTVICTQENLVSLQP